MTGTWLDRRTHWGQPDLAWSGGVPVPRCDPSDWWEPFEHGIPDVRPIVYPLNVVADPWEPNGPQRVLHEGSPGRVEVAVTADAGRWSPEMETDWVPLPTR